MPNGESLVELEICGEVVLAVMVLGRSLLLLIARDKKCQVTVVRGIEETVTHNTASPFPIFNNTTLNITQIKNKKHW